MELMTRKDVPQELTWDLTALYKTEADFQSDIDKVKALTDKIPGVAADPVVRGELQEPGRFGGL